MNRSIQIFIIITAIIVCACERNNNMNFGFNSSYTTDSSGLTIMHIGSHVAFITLEGVVTVDQGEIEIELINPAGEKVYTITLSNPGREWLSKTFDASRGYWKMRYVSRNGEGEIDLHVSY